VGYIVGRRELIDHIRVSHGLVEHVADGAVTTHAAGATSSIDDAPTFVAAVPTASEHPPHPAPLGRDSEKPCRARQEGAFVATDEVILAGRDEDEFANTVVQFW
jgi:hypothetical protein